MKKTLVIMSLTLAATIALSACGANTNKTTNNAATSTTAAASAKTAEVKTLTAAEAHDKIASGEKVVIVDVRRADEYAAGHIPGAVLIPNESIKDSKPAKLPVSDAQILVYCRTGVRAAEASKKLVDMGYTNVYNMGGIVDWTYGTEEGEWVEPDKQGKFTSFSTYDIDGLSVDESLFKGHKLTMINIWATYCSPCLREMPDIEKLSQSYASKGVSVVGIVSDVERNSSGIYLLAQIKTARSIIAQTGVTYRILLVSPDLYMAGLNDVDAVPTTIFVDENGKQVGQKYVGSRSEAQWAAIVDNLLKEV